MTIDFKKLRQNKGKGLADLTKQMENLKQKSGFTKDERIWKPQTDATCTAYHIVRFLPSIGEKGNIVTLSSYGLNCPGGWYIENSRKSLGEEEADPVAEYQAQLWQEFRDGGKSDELKAKAVKYFPRENYYANVLIVKDAINPENEGKVMIWEFGRAIQKKIDEAVKPQFEDETGIDPFDMWCGANFKVKIIGKDVPDKNTGKVKLLPNYEKCDFDVVRGIYDDPDSPEYEELFAKLHNIDEMVAEDKFKSYADLRKRWEQVMKGSIGNTNAEDTLNSKEAEPLKSASDTLSKMMGEESDNGVEDEQKTSPQKEEKSAPSQNESSVDADDADDNMAFFKGLVNKGLVS